MPKRLARIRVAVAASMVTPLLGLAQPAPGPTPVPSALPPGLLPPGVAPTAPAAGANPDSDTVTVRLIDDTIDQVLALLEMYTGRTILRPAALPTANPGYTLNIRKPIPKSEAILALETLLALNQIGVAPLGDKFLKVVPLAQVRTEAPEFIAGSALDFPPSGKVATKIFQFDFLRAAEFVPQLTAGGIFTPGVGGSVVVLDKANAAMVTDTVTNLQRVEMLLRTLDRPVTAGMTPKFYQLTASKASDLLTKLRAIITGPLQAQLGTATSFSADDRTNQIIVLADPRQYAFFDEIIKRLDIKSDPNTRNEVIRLKHALAKDVQTLLNTLVQGQTAAAQRTAANSVRPGQIAINGQTLQPGVQPGLQPVNPAAPIPGIPTALEGIIPPSNEFSGIVTVVNDDRTNSIVVSGTADDIRLIKELVGKIDSLLAQVSIEVIIAEVTLSDTDVDGVSALNLTFATDTPATGDNGRGTHLTNFAGTVGGWAVSSGVVNPLSFAAALQNVGQKNNVKVLQANSIITTHGKQGEFVVSQQQPIITGSTTTPSASTTGNSTTSSVTYKDIGVDVKVTPLIGDDGSIQLTVDQKVDDVVGNVTIDANSQPIIGHREATSTVNVDDGQMVVLGGLQTNKRSVSRSKLGFLYEIPIISNLLGGRNNETDRRELLVFIRPHILVQGEGSKDTNKQIDNLSNKKEVHEYLVNPATQPKKSLKDDFK